MLVKRANDISRENLSIVLCLLADIIGELGAPIGNGAQREWHLDKKSEQSPASAGTT